MRRVWRTLAIAICAVTAVRAGDLALELTATPPPLDCDPDASTEIRYCTSGGPGASQCEAEKYVTIGGLWVGDGCGISCGGNTYACCTNGNGFRAAVCTCEPDLYDRTPVSPAPDPGPVKR